MKSKTMYFCEYCDNVPFATETEAEAHEATHFGLPLGAFQVWHSLCACVEQAGIDVCKRRDEITLARYDKALAGLCRFEEDNGLSGKEKPTFRPYFLK